MSAREGASPRGPTPSRCSIAVQTARSAPASGFERASESGQSHFATPWCRAHAPRWLVECEYVPSLHSAVAPVGSVLLARAADGAAARGAGAARVGAGAAGVVAAARVGAGWAGAVVAARAGADWAGNVDAGRAGAAAGRAGTVAGFAA